MSARLPAADVAVTGSAADAGLVASASLIGTLLMLLPVGVVADKYPRKRVMVTASIVQMVVWCRRSSFPTRSPGRRRGTGPPP
ncbi:MAG TPA: hypothetical protein VGG25_14100 [Streptosporangiaceae bacterium]|jgi:MFS family permease